MALERGRQVFVGNALTVIRLKCRNPSRLRHHAPPSRLRPTDVRTRRGGNTCETLRPVGGSTGQTLRVAEVPPAGSARWSRRRTSRCECGAATSVIMVIRWPQTVKWARGAKDPFQHPPQTPAGAGGPFDRCGRAREGLARQ